MQEKYMSCIRISHVLHAEARSGSSIGKDPLPKVVYTNHSCQVIGEQSAHFWFGCMKVA